MKWSSCPPTGRNDIFTFSFGYTLRRCHTNNPSSGIPLEETPLQGPPRPTETPKDTTPTGALVNNLIRTVPQQTSLIEEQNWRLMDLEQARQLVQTKRTPSPARSRRGRSPRRSRSRSPRQSVSVRSLSHTRRSTRRRSLRWSIPRRSPPRRSPSRRNWRFWSPSSFEDNRDARNDCNAYGPFTRRIREAPIPRGLEKPL